MVCPPVRGDNPRALACGLSPVHVDKPGIIMVNHLHQCKTLLSVNYSRTSIARTPLEQFGT